MDAALEQSRLNYLSCKLAEMFSAKEDGTSSSPQVEAEPDIPLKKFNVSGRRVKFVDVSHVLGSHSAARPQSSRSILWAVEKPLRQGLRCRFPSPLLAAMQQYFQWLHNVSLCKMPSQDANVLLQELLKHLGLLELSRETQNYIKLKLQLFLDNKLIAASHRRTHGERRLEELADRQRRRVELMERQAVDAERMLNLRDSRAFHRLLLSELRERRRMEVLDRYFCLRHDEHLRALAAARKAQEEHIIKEAFDAALEKARQNRIERNNLMCEAKRRELEMQDLLITNLENRHKECIALLQDEQSKCLDDMDLQAKSNKLDNLREKMELRRQLTQQIKELEETLLSQVEPRGLRERNETHGHRNWSN
ncbi:unnamed protein product [Hydatigera taeniaeformis]|uniref:LisH domain-containing protein n=1 Tax=Hydatigena taeniaeformis TaxID=6205 RepID=A0A0R3X1Y0_HYDTA|nr:unnamed protein product [Hydatigera taeniaeformis]